MADRRAEQWVVEDLRPEDRESWAALHRGYLEFYEIPEAEQVSATVWEWLRSDGHELECIVARPEPGAAPVGIAHYRPFPRPLHGSTGCFLDDLFVAPEARGTGAVDALLAELQVRARDRGWAHVRWVTREGNSRARSAYDRLAQKSDLVTYDLAAAD